MGAPWLGLRAREKVAAVAPPDETASDDVEHFLNPTEYLRQSCEQAAYATQYASVLLDKRPCY
jgi:hypothetical protein